jgi:hypothetical protein
VTQTLGNSLSKIEAFRATKKPQADAKGLLYPNPHPEKVKGMENL